LAIAFELVVFELDFGLGYRKVETKEK